MSKDFEEFESEFKKHYQETFGKPYDKRKKMTVEDKKELEKAFLKTFNYDPDDEEVDARYDKEFNAWCDNLVK